MKMKKRFLASLMAMTVFACTITVPNVALADATKVITIGKDLSKEQKEKMYKYFGVKPDQVEVVEVNNQEERKYLEKVATEQQIGKKTYSCAYIEPTKSGSGINAKIANLNWLTSNMLASALTTAGIYDCNVVAAAPMVVSGTGALTGVMKAFEKVKDEKMDETKKQLATDELYTTGTLGEEIKDKDKAAGIVAEIKAEVIKKKVKADDEKQIKEIIIEVSKKYEVELTEKQITDITLIMKGVAKQDYDYSKFESTFDKVSDSISEKLNIDVNINGKSEKKEEATGFFGSIGAFFEKIGTGIADFFSGIGDWFTEVFTGKKAPTSDAKKDESGDAKKEESKDDKKKDDKDAGILNNTNDDALGKDAYIDSTNEGTISGDDKAKASNDANASASPDANDSKKDDAKASDSPKASDNPKASDSPKASETPKASDAAKTN